MKTEVKEIQATQPNIVSVELTLYDDNVQLIGDIMSDLTVKIVNDQNKHITASYNWEDVPANNQKSFNVFSAPANEMNATQLISLIKGIMREYAYNMNTDLN